MAVITGNVLLKYQSVKEFMLVKVNSSPVWLTKASIVLFGKKKENTYIQVIHRSTIFYNKKEKKNQILLSKPTS